MKILVSWLREIVAVDQSPRRIGADLQRCGFEVASVEPVDGLPIESDAVLDLEITANRPDCLSVLGMAREVATIYGLPLANPLDGLELPPSSGAEASLGPLTVRIDDAERCPRYVAMLADVVVGPSPEWLAARLRAIGIRAINNVVDVTNYVLAEVGQPLHAFDLARLAGAAIVVRVARPDETLTTLDGQARVLAPDMLVIADRDRAQAVAGVMGGSMSEVTGATRTIVLESAYFQPRSVRRTSKRLGLSTEASYRFERGTDPELPPLAAARACALLTRIGAGHARPGLLDCRPVGRTGTVVDIRASRITRVLGAPVPSADTERILTTLGFEASRTGVSGASDSDASAAWRVHVPSWRGDVTREVDLIEEVARHHGYERLPDTFPALDVAPSPPGSRLERDRLARRVAAAAGFNESVTFSFIERRAALDFAAVDELVAIANPLSESFAVLRPSLLPGLLDSVSHNRRRGIRDVRLFELGSRFTAGHGESRTIALAWTGLATAEHWSGTGRLVDFFDIKGAVEALCTHLGLDVAIEAAERPWLVAGRSAAVVVEGGAGGGRTIGAVGLVTPALAVARDIPAQDAVFMAEIDLDAIQDLWEARAPVASAPLPRFPSVVRDLAIVVGEGLPAAGIRGTIRRVAPATLVSVREFDRYQGKALGDGMMSLAVRLTFQAPDRTLTDVEVQQAVDRIVDALGADHGARLR